MVRSCENRHRKVMWEQTSQGHVRIEMVRSCESKHRKVMWKQANNSVKRSRQLQCCSKRCWFEHHFDLFGRLGFLTSSSATRLSRGLVSSLNMYDNFTCRQSPPRDRAGRPWLLTQSVILFWHRPNQKRAGGQSEDRTHDLLIRSRRYREFTRFWVKGGGVVHNGAPSRTSYLYLMTDFPKRGIL